MNLQPRCNFVDKTIFVPYVLITEHKIAAAVSAGAAAGAGYLAYTGKLIPLAIATAEKASALASSAYTLGCQGCVAAAPYASAGYANTIALVNYSITVLTPYAAAASAKAAPYTAMIGMTPVTLSIALGATATLVLIVMLIKKNRELTSLLDQNKKLAKQIADECKGKVEENKLMKELYKAKYGHLPNQIGRNQKSLYGFNEV